MFSNINADLLTSTQNYFAKNRNARLLKLWRFLRMHNACRSKALNGKPPSTMKKKKVSFSLIFFSFLFVMSNWTFLKRYEAQ